MRVHPYKTADKKIDGAVIPIFLDVETMKQTEISITKGPRDSAEDIFGDGPRSLCGVGFQVTGEASEPRCFYRALRRKT